MSGQRHGESTATRRGFASIVFSFFLSIALALSVVLATVRIGIASEAGFISIFDDAYFESLLSYTTDKITSYTYPTGIDPSVVEGVVTLEDVERDVRGIVTSAFDGAEYEPDLSGIESRLTAQVSTFILAQESEMSGSSEEVVSTYIQEVEDLYLNYMKLPGLDSIVKVRNTYLEYLTMALGVCLGISVVLMVGIRSLHHFLHRSLRFVAYATGGAALMCLIVPLILFLSHPYDGLRLKPLYFYHFGITAITRTLMFIIMGGAVLMVLTVVLVMLIGRMRDSVVHRHSHASRPE